MSWALAAAATPTESQDADASSYIMKWAEKFGEDQVIPAMERQQFVVNPQPVAFAFLDSNDYKIKVLHSVCRIKLSDETAEGHNDIVGFIGDRRQSRRGTWKDPPAVTIPPTTFKQVSGKAATATKCNSATQEAWTTFLEAARNAGTSTVPLLLPLPHLWLKFFLLQPRHPLEAWIFLKQETNNWTGSATSTPKKAQKLVRDWCRMASTGAPSPRADDDDDGDEPPTMSSVVQCDFDKVSYVDEAVL
jgi:hypothetical protein